MKLGAPSRLLRPRPAPPELSRYIRSDTSPQAIHGGERVAASPMWRTERGAKAVQVGVLLAAGWLASYDVDRTMRQQPMTPNQAAEVQQMIEQRQRR